MKRAVNWVLQGLVRFYSWGPGRLLPQSCRFRPTCSAYMLRALQLHGPFRGLFLGTKRICRCHPWNEGGLDPVPGDEDRFMKEDYPALTGPHTNDP